jgi:aldehyde dehydrogenase (NAD+)
LPTARSVQAALFQIQQLVDGLPHYPFEEVHGSYTLRKEPIGVCGLIPPWNYPALQMTEKVAQRWRRLHHDPQAAEIASHSGAVFAEIVHAAGVPRGVFNMVVGKGSIVGTALTATLTWT